MTTINESPLLKVENLEVSFKSESKQWIKTVKGISFSIPKNKTVALVGESGSGKSVTSLAVMGLLPKGQSQISEQSQIRFEDKDLLNLSVAELRNICGKDIAMIFQEPMSSLNPVFTVGDQIAEVIYLHQKVTKVESKRLAAEMLEVVGIPKERFGEYLHQFSGGMKQRVIIAMALACNPKLLIADEPTTALDVTIQAQVLRMMNDLKSKNGTAVLLITHDLGVIAEMCQRVAVIYSGEIVEMGTAEDLFDRTAHPYTMGLFDSLPRVSSGDRLIPIPGMMPDPSNLPKGCKFAERCKYATDVCREQEVDLTEIEPGHYCRCIHKLTKEGRL